MQVPGPLTHRMPRTVEEFKKEFHNESISQRFLFLKRWPQGFECPYCNWINEKQQPAKTIICSHCGHPTSITTNTIMHGTKKTLTEWLVCIWWLASTESGHSAKDLQRLLHLSSYQTAWTWLQKLRIAMSVSDNKVCRGTVEINENTISLGGDKREKEHILTAAEIILPSGITGRIKMQAISVLTDETVSAFLKNNVSAGTSLVVPNKSVYEGVDRNTYVAVPASDNSMTHRIEQIVQSFELWLNKIHRGGVVKKHLQLYLDEFCFRSNAAMLPDTTAVFHLLLSGVLSQKSVSYKNLTSPSPTE